MTRKEINPKNYRIIQYLNGTIIYQGWHKGCHIGGGGGCGGGSSYNAIGADVLPKWRELDEKRHYKIITQLKKAVSEGRLKVIPVGELINSEDFIQIDGVTVPHESIGWIWFFKQIGKFLYHVLMFPQTNQTRHTDAVFRGLRDKQKGYTILKLEEQQTINDETNEDEDEMMEAESGSDPN